MSARPTIGVLIGWQAYEGTLNSFLGPLFRGLQTAARERGCNLLLSCGIGHHPDLVHPAWPEPMVGNDFLPVGPWNTDGLIVLAPLRSEARSQYVQGLIASGFPIVFVAPGERGPTLLVDNEGGIRQAVAHLVDHGHRRIAFIAGLSEHDSDSEYRLRAYHAALHAHGLTVDPRLVADSGFTTPGGYRALRQIVEGGATFTAVLAFNDESAIGAMQALRDLGRRVPDDVAVIGFDDRLEALAQIPPLTSVHQPLVEMGFRAFELLGRYVARELTQAETIRVPTRLAVRQSCGCQPGSASQAEAHAAAGRQEAGPAPAPLPNQLAERIYHGLPVRERTLAPDQVRLMCERLAAAALERGAPRFLDTLIELLHAVERTDDDAHDWQWAISALQHYQPPLVEAAVLHQARIAISESEQRRYSRYVVRQLDVAVQLGRMSARLHTAFDEMQIFEILAETLPGFGIQQAQIAFFEPEGEDGVAWSRLRTLVGAGASPHAARRFPSREFPPRDLYPPDQPYQLALLPMMGSAGQAGYMVFDADRLGPLSAIVGQVESAVRSARLYREAAEGRRLAEEANRVKSGFLSMVSHELRTPLNLIVGLSDMLMRESADRPPLPSAHRQDAKRIQDSAQHLGWLIRDVLDMASSEAGQLRLASEVVTLGDDLRAVSEVGEQLTREKGLVWRALLRAPLPPVWGDRARLRQVMLNLISNAVKFTRHGQVSLTAEAAEGQVRVSVTDTGLGVPLDEQQAIFEEFRQSGRTRARGFGGMGLGLAICKRLIELHGGAIGVRSTGVEGSGSTFFFTLPVWTETPPSQAEGVGPGARSQTVWVLSGQAGEARRVAEFLRNQGFDVASMAVDDAADLPARLRASPPGAVVLDLNLTSGSGWDVLRLLKNNAATQDVPVLFYSLGQAGGSLLEMEYLTKPVAMTDLALALARQGLLAGGEEKTVLVVDDEPAILELNARMVQSQSPGNRVLKAHNGREALEILRQRPVDLVLLDLMMPEVDGFEVLEAMRAGEATRDIPVIVLTARLLTEVDMVRLNRGVASVLEKGMFSVDETLAHIEEVLSLNRKLGSEAQRLVRKAMAFMHEHYAEALTRESIAGYVGVSEDYLTRCFQQELRMPPMTYLTRYRVNQAKSLLAAGELSLAEVADAAGFSSEVYFSRVFRREVGVAPGAYRRGQRGGSPPAGQKK